MLSNFGGAGAQHLVVPPEPLPPPKRLRIDRIEQDAGTPVGRVLAPEMRKEPAYLPQVENISPTPESDRDRIIEKISKIDRDIAVAESDLKRLKKQEVRNSMYIVR